MSVDSGSTAQYVYDALNNRVSVTTASSAHEYLFDSNYGSPFDPSNPTHGDQPNDQAEIKAGIAAYQAGCHY